MAKERREAMSVLQRVLAVSHVYTYFLDGSLSLLFLRMLLLFVRPCSLTQKLCMSDILTQCT